MTRALITGGTAGIGLEFAWQLAREGHDLILVARDEDRLQVVADQLREGTGVDVEILVADLSERSELRLVQRRLIDPVTQVDMLVNNAGYGLAKTFLETDLAGHEKHLDVLVRTVLVLSYDAARVMTARGHGAIINVSSIASLTTMGTYAAAKSWVTVFSEALAEQLRGTGVHVTALLPGYVRTEFHDRARINAKKIPGVAWLSADEVVAQCLEDVNRGIILSIPSRKYQVIAHIANGMPRGMMRRISWGLSSSRHRNALPAGNRTPMFDADLTHTPAPFERVYVATAGGETNAPAGGESAAQSVGEPLAPRAGESSAPSFGGEQKLAEDARHESPLGTDVQNADALAPAAPSATSVSATEPVDQGLKSASTRIANFFKRTK